MAYKRRSKPDLGKYEFVSAGNAFGKSAVLEAETPYWLYKNGKGLLCQNADFSSSLPMLRVGLLGFGIGQIKKQSREEIVFSVTTAGRSGKSPYSIMLSSGVLVSETNFGIEEVVTLQNRADENDTLSFKVKPYVVKHS